ncbi:family 20 glycosylhydrolase [Aureibacter tunicatorum]|uniref:beta-N-acetylhexosaminidase n=1 Tax=Aureibacter tunicatorum TaxID=866807 RepID=A0AAE4BT15_9BACT|nr:family 20 glycosylhydrolase [Aureibacter tunicatorum]MDR6241749.1 hexosaminidase [Aureibacter tunicatorum]BDD07389.1 beta-N-acetylhexosaminidase [Aureibacter tunicatorum]
MKKILLSLSLFWLFSACHTKVDELSNNIAIIPQPVTLDIKKGNFELSSATRIIFEKSQTSNADFLRSYLHTATGVNFDLKEANEPSKGAIFLTLDKSLKPSQYTLNIAENQIIIKGGDDKAVFYGVQSLRQLLPPSFEKSGNTSDIYLLPNVNIKDWPRFPYRGLHLDVGRHFMSKEFIKKYIDMLALHKMDKFHWHLTEGQGWRIEIKKYPKLTDIGAWRTELNGDKYGGFYTQEDIKEIVEYAQENYITIIPEIEFPGHSLAAMAAYPELSCTGGPFDVRASWCVGLSEDVYCPGTPKTFEFMENVLAEVIDLFPSEYIHIGGDECPKSRWMECSKCKSLMDKEGIADGEELQSYFIKRIEKVLNKHNRKMIGWDEILEGGLAETATVMSWRGEEGGIEAAKMGRDVIMTPNSHMYFDYYQGNPVFEPKAFDDRINLRKVYEYDPVPSSLSTDEKQRIIGVQANLWTEFMPNESQVEYMTFPRIAALAEVAWTPLENKSWEKFMLRIPKMMQRYEALGINYSKSVYTPELKESFDNTRKEIKVTLSTNEPRAKIYYTLDDSNPDPENAIEYSDPIIINTTSTLKACLYLNGKPLSNIISKTYEINKSIGRKVVFGNPPSKSYQGTGEFNLVNGVRGSIAYNDGQWNGFKNDFECTIDLGNLHHISSVRSGFLQDLSKWIAVPEYFEVYTSKDGVKFSKAGKKDLPLPRHINGSSILDVLIEFEPLQARYIKVLAKSSTLPKEHNTSDLHSWIFVDEIIID